MVNNILVGGIPTPLKNMKVTWDHYSQYIMEQKMFQTTNQYYIFLVTVCRCSKVSYSAVSLQPVDYLPSGKLT